MSKDELHDKIWKELEAIPKDEFSFHRAARIATEAALLYGESKWDEACDEQRDVWQKRMPMMQLKTGQISTLQFIEYLRGQPKPPFKP